LSENEIVSFKSEDLVQTIKDRRVRVGLSQRALSERSGLTQAHISQIETGKLEPGLASFIDLARALDLEVVLVPRKALPAVEGLLREAPAGLTSLEEGGAALREVARGDRVISS